MNETTTTKRYTNQPGRSGQLLQESWTHTVVSERVRMHPGRGALLGERVGARRVQAAHRQRDRALHERLLLRGRLAQDQPLLVGHRELARPQAVVFLQFQL